VSNYVIESAVSGQQTLTNVGNPGTRDMLLSVRSSLGFQTLTGIPVDVAFDNLRNLTGLRNAGGNSSIFAAGTPAPVNGKRMNRAQSGQVVGVGVFPSNAPRFMFVAVPNAPGTSGVLNVVNISAGGAPLVDTNVFQPGVQSVPAPNVVLVADYFRQ